MKFSGFGWCVCAGLMLVLFSCNPSAKKTPQIKNGVLDLRNWDFEKDGNINLDGNWAFYWEKLYRPSDLKNPDTPPAYLRIPDGWNRFSKDKSWLHSGDGYGTYHLTILLRKPQESLGLSIPTVATALEAWIDNQMVCRVGQVGKDEKTSFPAYYPQAVFITAPQDSLEIVLQISNFHYRKGGAWDSLVLGSQQSISQYMTLTIIRDFFIIGGLLLIGLYYLITFLIIRHDFSILYFSFFCLLTSIRLLFSDMYHINLLTTWAWHWIVRIELLTFYLAIPAFCGFVYFGFPKELPRRLFQAVIGISMFFSLIVLLLPIKVVSFTVVAFEIFSVLCCCGMTVILFRIWRHRHPGGLLFLIGFLILFITFVNDILYLNNVLLTGRWMYLGIFLFTLFLAITLAHRLSLTYISLAHSNAQLRDKNQEIEEKNEELVKLNQELDAFVYRTSHDLRSPIVSVMGLLEIAKYEQDPAQLQQYFEMGRNVLKRMDNLISDIISYARNARADTLFEKIEFPQLLEEIFANFAFLENAGQIEKKYTINLHHDFFSDCRRLSFILNNLISNAIKYHDISKPQPFIQVTVEEKDKQVQIEVSDNGQGISAEHLDKVFQMFYRASNASKGAGLGLYIVKETVIKLQGTITLTSVPGEGTTFRVLLPNMRS